MPATPSTNRPPACSRQSASAATLPPSDGTTSSNSADPHAVVAPSGAVTS